MRIARRARIIDPCCERGGAFSTVVRGGTSSRFVADATSCAMRRVTTIPATFHAGERWRRISDTLILSEICRSLLFYSTSNIAYTPISLASSSHLKFEGLVRMGREYRDIKSTVRSAAFIVQE